MLRTQGSIAQALAANTAVQVVGKVVSTTIGVVVVGLLTRLLGTEGFGKYATANAFLQVFAILMDLGLNVLLVQMLGEHAGDEKKEKQIVSSFFTLRVVMASIILTLGVGIAWLIPAYDMELKLAIVAIWGSFFFTLLNQVVVGVQQRHLKMHVVAISEVAGRVTLLIGVLIAIAQGWGLVPVILIVSLGGFINFILNYVVATRYADFSWNPDIAMWKMAIRRAWPIGVSILFSLIYYKADALVLSWVRPWTEVGVYSAAYRVLEVLVALPFMYAGVLLPIIARAWKDGATGKFRTLVQRSLDAMALVTFPMIFGTLAVAVPLMALVTGSEFDGSGDILKILILATGAIFLATVFSHAIVALNAQKAMLPWYIWTAVFAVIGYVTLIPTYGMWAAAWLTVGSEAAILVGNIIVVAKRAEMKIDWSVTGKSLVASVAMFLVAYKLVDYSLFLAIGAGAVVYVGLIFAMKAVTPDIVRELMRARSGAPQGDESL
jgi:O-antigen/teichoic acid export membrane protein